MKKPIKPCPQCAESNSEVTDSYEEIKPNGKPNYKTGKFPTWTVFILKCRVCGKVWRVYL